MKRTFQVEGLDCANCAAKMERGIQALEGVNSCSINFMTGKLTVEAPDERMDEILEAAGKIVKKVEPGALLKKA